MDLSFSLKIYFLLNLLCLVLNVSAFNLNNVKENTVFLGGNFPALYVIGDSLVDSGNNNNLETFIKSNFPPYGSNFEGGKATGRFSDGKTIADFIANYYGLPLAPAYLGLTEEQKNCITTGINYASASCGVFPNTGKKFGHCLSMSVQVDLFNRTIEENLKKKFKTKTELDKHLSESLFMSAIGVNDYVFFYNKTVDPISFANNLLHEYLLQIKRLHKLGARKFFINNIKPLGCYPNIIAHTTPAGTCNDNLNLVIRLYNDKLRKSLSTLKKKLSNTSFLYSDYFNFMLNLRRPSNSTGGSTPWNTRSPCCPKVYDGGLTTSCMQDSIACQVPEKYVFFDPFHPTQFANFMYSIECFHGSRVCSVV